MIKNFIHLLKSVIIIFIVYFLLYTLILSLKRYFAPGILFYEGNWILIFILISILGAFHYKYGYRENLVYETLIAFLLCLFIHSTIVTIVDRSISVFILDRIDKKDSSISSIQYDFENEYSNGAIAKRIEEQKDSKNVNLNKNNKLELTLKGKFWITIFRSFSFIFLLDKNITK